MNFYCDVCDVERARTSKAKHLKSKIHLRNLGHEVETKPLGRPQAPPYICKVCNTRPLKAASEKTHLISKIHIDNVRRSNESQAPAQAPTPTPSTSTSTTIKDSDDYHIYKKAFKGKDKTYSIG